MIKFEKMFQKQPFNMLKENIKYYIVCHDIMPISYIGIFRGFKGIKTINAQFTNVSVLYPGFSLENKKTTTFFWSNNKNRSFYKFISLKHKIQENMEKRSLEIILKHIIGDENFIWY
jgi:hypothetical protein